MAARLTVCALRTHAQFVDEVAARNKGTSFVKDMESRAATQGKADGKFVDEARCCRDCVCRW